MIGSSDPGTRSWLFYGALALTAMVTLVVEVIDTRLLSAITWYHLAFAAISLAMLGMTAGAVYAYLRPRRFAGEAPQLGRFAILFGLSVPLSHLALIYLCASSDLRLDWMGVSSGIFGCALIATPFFFSGVLAAVALTWVRLPIGRLYAADLIGAAGGCAAAVGLMEAVDPTSAMFMLGAAAAVAAAAFLRWEGRQTRLAVAVSLVLLAAGSVNHWRYPHLFWLSHMKGVPVLRPVLFDRWNSHSRITAHPEVGRPFLWSPGRNYRPSPAVEEIRLLIDGAAMTYCTHFAGDVRTLQWLLDDLTSFAYSIRGQGEVAVIGVGGGRDLLAAVGAGSRHVTGIEINDSFLRLLGGRLRRFAGLAARPDVSLVHSDGRAWLARTPNRYDLIQMALVDTWASTSAGAMTLSENGLYTAEAWATFLSRLRPGGVLAVSRWYSPGAPGETARLVALAMSALHRSGVADSQRHLVLTATDRLANLILARDPLSPADLSRLRGEASRAGFSFLVFPGQKVDDPTLARIVAARDEAQLAAATANPTLILAAPTDDTPFFFNMLRPSAWLRVEASRNGGVLEGNLRATETLVVIFVAVLLLVVVSILIPLSTLRGERPYAGSFTYGALYFSLIGGGFMLVEIALIQRFSVLLGHPIYSMVTTLLSLILATGLGSYLSDAVPQRWLERPILLAPLAAATIAGATFAARAEVRLAISLSLTAKVLCVLAVTTPLGLALGLCFPLGMRLVRERGRDILPWMWGLNGAFGVLGSILAVVASLTWGITVCMLLGAACYLALTVPILGLSTTAAAAARAGHPVALKPGTQISRTTSS